MAAVKLALKVGPDRFYQYIRDFGFGSRSGVELPGETRGLLRPVKRWSASSIGSIAIGQEVAVTPLQLVSMVSTIANGGVYLPPHVLMPDQLDPTNSKPKGRPTAGGAGGAALQAGEDLPNPLPAGAHRVISTLTAAQMRKMMEGVVLFGTGKQAQLNGYSSGGKTGTAQKIDPATHTYSKTMHIASFAGFAPVNNPVIAVAVIIDSPKGAYYGADVSAPVFAEVAQQVLEYLGVPHDIDLRPPSAASKAERPSAKTTPRRRKRHPGALRRRQRSAQRRSPAPGIEPDCNRQPARRSSRESGSRSCGKHIIEHQARIDCRAASFCAAARYLSAAANDTVTVTDARASARPIAHRSAGAQGHRTSRRRRPSKSRSSATAHAASRPPIPAPWSLPEPKS